MAAFKTYTFMLGGLLLAVYLNYPAPSLMSTNLVSWKTSNSKTIIFNKNRVFYKDQPGNRVNAPVLLCLHGFPTSSYDWLKVWPALLDKFSRVIAPDFLGFGFSDKPSDHAYSLAEQADIVEHILQYQRVKELHILAHDMGDTVAQELLARYEDRLKSGTTPKLIIKSVCLLNGGIFPETNFPRPVQQILLTPYVGPILARLTNIYVFKRGFGEVFGPKTQPTEEEFHDFYALHRRNDGYLRMPQLIQYIPERFSNKHRWTSVLQKTKVPVHVVYGPADPVNPAGFVDYYKEIIPNPSIAVLEGHVGHYPQWEDSAGCMAAYFSFIKTLPFSGSVPRHGQPSEPQGTPDVTVSQKRSGKLPPPDVVVQKMKAREMEQEAKAREREQEAKMEEERRQKEEQKRVKEEQKVKIAEMKRLKEEKYRLMEEVKTNQKKAKLDEVQEAVKKNAEETKQDVNDQKQGKKLKKQTPKPDKKPQVTPQQDKATVKTEEKDLPPKNKATTETVKKPIQGKAEPKPDKKQRASDGKPKVTPDLKTEDTKSKDTASSIPADSDTKKPDSKKPKPPKPIKDDTVKAKSEVKDKKEQKPNKN